MKKARKEYSKLVGGDVVILIGPRRIELYNDMAKYFFKDKDPLEYTNHIYLQGDPFTYADFSYFRRIAEQLLSNFPRKVMIYHTDNLEGLWHLSKLLNERGNETWYGSRIKIWSLYTDKETKKNKIWSYSLSGFITNMEKNMEIRDL